METTTKTAELIERHQAAITTHRYMLMEAAELRLIALSHPNAGQRFRASTKRDRVLDRSFGVTLRMSDIEEMLCTEAEKGSKRALAYLDGFYGYEEAE